MTALATPAAGRPGLDLWVRHFAFSTLLLLPPGMALMHRSSPLFLTVAALLSLFAAALGGRVAAAGGAAAQGWATPLGRAAAAFAALALVSTAWSPVPAASLHALGEFALPVGAALVLAATAGPRLPRALVWLSGSVALAAALILVELATDLALHRALGMRSDTYIFNRPVLTLLVLVVPLVAAAAGPGTDRLDRWSVAFATLATVAAILRSDSGTAVVGLLVAAGTALLARLAPRLALWLAVLGFVLATAAAPVAGDALARLIPSRFHERLAEAHSAERVEIWQAFGAAIRVQPLLGAGFGASSRMVDSPALAQVAADNRPALVAGHPHNAALQVWAELGAAGAALALAVPLLWLRRLWTLPGNRLWPPLALTGAAAAVALIGHGAWQGWWAASLGAAFVVLNEEPGDESPRR